MIDRSTIDKILDATDIVEVVSDFVTLRKAGVNYKGLCPFHDDKTPSFVVSPSKGICHCFACGKGGNAVNFLMEHEQISYPDALRWLARKYNIEIKERELTEEEQREATARESMLIVNEWAKNYFHNIIYNDIDGQTIGMTYFRERGFRDDIIKKFQLGFSLSDRTSLSREALSHGYKEDYLLLTGLCYKREGGHELIDRYSGRVIFPWFNVSGKVVAFGGRLLDSRTKGVQQKYINSPDSDIFHKERELYGLFQAKRQISKEDLVYMVEGYTDVLAMHQCGIENVVANSGTALSKYQIRLLHRFTTNIVLLYDGDEAGIHAALRGTDMLLGEGMNVKVLLLPGGDDPDSFSHKHSSQEFKDYVFANQVDFIQFKSNVLLDGVTDPIKRSEAISSIVGSISVIPDAIKRDTYIHQCAEQLHVKESTIVSSLNAIKLMARKDSPDIAQLSPQQPNAEGDKAERSVDSSSCDNQTNQKILSLERLLIQQIIRYGNISIIDAETEDGTPISLNVAQYIAFDLSSDDLTFHNPLYNTILEEAVKQTEDKTDFQPEYYFTHHPNVEISRLASDMVFMRYQLTGSFEENVTGNSIRTTVEHLILDYRKAIMQQVIDDLQLKLRITNEHAEQLKLMQQLRDSKLLHDAIAQKLGNDILS